MSILSQRQPRREQPSSELIAAFASCRGAFAGVGLFSALSNILMLNGAFFMLLVYDRVLPSRSLPTLAGLAIMASVLYVFQGALDAIRGRILVRIGALIDAAVSGRIYHAVVQLAVKSGGRNDGVQPLRDLDSVRAFLSGQGVVALFDLPWVPLYLGVCFMLHPMIGITALGGAVILAALALATEIVTRQPTKSATSCAMARNGLAETSQRNAEVLVAMGMVGRMQDRWSEINASCVASHKLMSDVADSLGAVSRTLRMMLQSGLLAVGAYLVVHQEATGGIIIAGSILGGRALGPVDLAIANWRSFVAARQSWGRLGKLLALCPVEALPLPLHKPTKTVTMESASVAPPGEPRLVVQDASFSLSAGQALGVIGPSASGKSSLVRLLVGVWAPLRGKVCLDGASLDQWAPDTRGRNIGYLPQDVELLAGSVAENIARFEPHADPNAVVAAAHAAGVHDVIVKLPDGYDTQVGEQGSALSAGQRQWIALARAFYGDPFLVVLDEPNSNLDAVGEEALARAIVRARSRGAIVVVVAHRPSVITAVDLVLVMANGRVQAVGPKDEVLGAALRRDVPAARSPNVISLAGAASS